MSPVLDCRISLVDEAREESKRPSKVRLSSVNSNWIRLHSAAFWQHAEPGKRLKTQTCPDSAGVKTKDSLHRLPTMSSRPVVSGNEMLVSTPGWNLARSSCKLHPKCFREVPEARGKSRSSGKGMVLDESGWEWFDNFQATGGVFCIFRVLHLRPQCRGSRCLAWNGWPCLVPSCLVGELLGFWDEWRACAKGLCEGLVAVLCFWTLAFWILDPSPIQGPSSQGRMLAAFHRWVSGTGVGDSCISPVGCRRCGAATNELTRTVPERNIRINLWHNPGIAILEDESSIEKNAARVLTCTAQVKTTIEAVFCHGEVDGERAFFPKGLRSDIGAGQSSHLQCAGCAANVAPACVLGCFWACAAPRRNCFFCSAWKLWATAATGHLHILGTFVAKTQRHKDTNRYSENMWELHFCDLISFKIFQALACQGHLFRWCWSWGNWGAPHCPALRCQPFEQ